MGFSNEKAVTYSFPPEINKTTQQNPTVFIPTIGKYTTMNYSPQKPPHLSNPRDNSVFIQFCVSVVACNCQLLFYNTDCSTENKEVSWDLTDFQIQVPLL